MSDNNKTRRDRDVDSIASFFRTRGGIITGIVLVALVALAGVISSVIGWAGALGG